MANVGDLVVKLKANTRGFTRAMKGASKNVGLFSSKLGALAGTGGVAAAGLLVTAGAAVVLKRALSKVISELKESFDRLDSLAKTGARLGVPTEKLAGLRFAAGLAGASVKELDTGLQNLARRSSEAAEGTGEGVDALKKLGIEAKRFNKLSVDNQFLKIADAMGDVKNQNDKVAIAFDLFGRSGVKLLNLLDGGVGNLLASMAKARLMGIAPTEEELARIEAANDAINIVGQQWDGIFNTLAIGIAPTVIVLAEETSKWLMLAKSLALTFDIIADRIENLPSVPVTGKFSLALALTRKMVGGVADLNDAFDEGRKKLEDQIAASKELRKAIADGAADEKKRANLKSFAEGVKESLLTPLQRFGRDAAKLREALSKNLIDSTDFDKATQKLREQLFIESGVTAQIEKQKKLREDAAAKQLRATEALRDAAKSVFDETRSPFERFRTEVERLKDLHAKFPDVLNADTLRRAIGNAREQFEDSTGGPSDTTITRALAGSAIGSKDFFDSIQRSRVGANSPEQKTAKATTKIAASQEKQVLLLTKVEKNTKKQTVVRRSKL